MTTERDAFFLRFWGQRYGPPCPYCGAPAHYDISTRGALRCVRCLRHYSATSGTAFHGSKMPFETINRLLRMLDEGKNPYRISQVLGIQYVTAHKYAKAHREGSIGKPIDRRRDRDGSPEGSETHSGSTEGNSPDPKGIAP